MQNTRTVYIQSIFQCYFGCVCVDQTKEELTRLRRDVVRSPKSPKTSLAAQAVLRRVENERDDAISELRKMTTDRDTLRERLKVCFLLQDI